MRMPNDPYLSIPRPTLLEREPPHTPASTQTCMSSIQSPQLTRFKYRVFSTNERMCFDFHDLVQPTLPFEIPDIASRRRYILLTSSCQILRKWVRCGMSFAILCDGWNGQES
jgi:hypothetical protein